VKTFLIATTIFFSIGSFAQNGINTTSNCELEVASGMITGKVITADNRPASYVTISLKENYRTTITDENGLFTLKNIKEGSYTLQVSMVGLKPQQQLIAVKKAEQTNVLITLNENVKQLGEIVITSGKRLNGKPAEIGKISINPMDLPQALSVIGHGVIRDQQAQRLSDVIKNVNGVYLSSTRGNVQESFSARGYSFSSYNMFKNGARINAGAMPEMSSLERVEILKGSTAILFGQVAPGAVINMVTKEPKFKSGGEVSVRLGSYDLYKPAFDVYGPISKSVAYRLNGTFESANSFRDGVSSKRYYINPSFLFKLGNKTELLTEADYLYHNLTPDFGIGTINNTIIPDVPRNRFYGTSWQYNAIQQSTATATLKHHFSDSWKLNTSVSYQYYTRDYYGAEKITASVNGDWTRTLGNVLSYENSYTAQVNITGKIKTGKINHDLLSGIDADHYLTLNNDFSFPAVSGLPAAGYDKINLFDLTKFQLRADIPVATNVRKRTAPVNRFGAYVQDLVKITPKLNLLAGIRWSYVQTVGIDSLNTISNTTSKGKTKADKALSPRLGIVYKPTTATSLFASYSNSFVVNTGQDIQGNSLDPSMIDQYEVGVKNEFFRGLFSANVTLYRIRNNDLAQTAPALIDGTPNTNTAIKVLTGETVSDGVEVDVASHPIKGLDINAGYSYNYARYTKTVSSTGSNKEGETLINNPKHTANATVFYSFNDKLFSGLKLGASIFYVGDRMGGYNNTVNQTQSYSRLIPVNGYTTIDVSAGYSFKKLSVLGKVSNLTNTLNWNVHENYSINPIPPTQFIVTVSYKL
jgi:iron complex outermembrane recepter protein